MPRMSSHRAPRQRSLILGSVLGRKHGLVSIRKAEGKGFLLLQNRVPRICPSPLGCGSAMALPPRHRPAPPPCRPLSLVPPGCQAERDINPWLSGRTRRLPAALPLPCSEAAKNIPVFLLQVAPGQEPPVLAQLSPEYPATNQQIKSNPSGASQVFPHGRSAFGSSSLGSCALMEHHLLCTLPRRAGLSSGLLEPMDPSTTREEIELVLGFWEPPKLLSSGAHRMRRTPASRPPPAHTPTPGSTNTRRKGYF